MPKKTEPSSSSTKKRSSTTSATEVVQAFFAAATQRDFETAFGFLADDIEYQNVPFPPQRGRKSVEGTLRLLMRVVDQLEIEMLNIAERDGVVLTERTDRISGPALDLEFWCCGTFEVRNGKIAVWRDRFDLVQVGTQLATSPLRKLIRAGATWASQRNAS